MSSPNLIQIQTFALSMMRNAIHAEHKPNNQALIRNIELDLFELAERLGYRIQKIEVAA